MLTVRLQQALARHFSYPLLARKKGWEGEVMLAFRIEPDGTISSAHIARSSGYGALDQAALGALNRVGRIEDAPRQGLSLKIPVIYRLQEG